MSASDPGFIAALSEAQKGASEGGVPIGACLVSRDGKILGQGHNMRVQKGSATLHVCLSFLYPRRCIRPFIGNMVYSPEPSFSEKWVVWADLILIRGITKGRDVRPRVLWSASCSRVSGRDHVHHAVTV